MSTSNGIENGSVRQLVMGRLEPSGKFTAEAVGIPELRATAATQAEAIDQVRAMLGEWLASGKLVSIDVPLPNPLLQFRGHLDPNDPLEREFVEELRRQRQRDIEDTLRESGPECSNSCSTPTT